MTKWHYDNDVCLKSGTVTYVRSRACGDFCHVMHCLADLGSCTDCQQGGLLKLGSRWYIWPATRPVAVRLERRRLFGFLSEAVMGPSCRTLVR